LWTGLVTVSEIGDDALYFALGWTATGYGGTVTGWVLAATVGPRVLLTLVGGAVTDRLNPRSVVACAEGTLALGCAGTAVLLVLIGPSVWLLVAFAMLLGIATAFQFPASGALTVSVVATDDLPRAMGLRQLGYHVASLTGGPVGGLLVAVGGLLLVLGVNAATFLMVLGSVLLLRPAVSDRAPRESLARTIGAGLRTAWSDRALRTVFGLYAVIAGCALPVVALLVPLLGREQARTAAQAGLIVGAMGLGGAVTALVVARFGVYRHAATAIAVSLGACAAGMLLLAATATLPVSIAAGLLQGAGLAAFIAHAGPLVVALSPPAQIGRLQSVLSVVQSVALIVTNPALGALAQATTARAAVAAAAVPLLVAAALTVRLDLSRSDQPGGGVRR
jgi:MFS family permease